MNTVYYKISYLFIFFKFKIGQEMLGKLGWSCTFGR